MSWRDTILTIVWCLSWNWDNSIAEQISKQMKITVLAPEEILIADDINDYFISGWEYYWPWEYVSIIFNWMQSNKVDFKEFNP